MAIVIRYMCCLVFISRSSDLIQYGGIVTKANCGEQRIVLKFTALMSMLSSGVGSSQVLSKFWYFFPILQH